MGKNTNLKNLKSYIGLANTPKKYEAQAKFIGVQNPNSLYNQYESQERSSVPGSTSDINYGLCEPPIYEEDLIVNNIIESEEGITIQIESNPFTNVVLQVSVFDCQQNPLQIETVPAASNPYNYFITFAMLDQSCYVGFRKVCNELVSEWNILIA